MTLYEILSLAATTGFGIAGIILQVISIKRSK